MEKLFEFDIHVGDWRVLVQNRDIANQAVSEEKLGNGSVTARKIADGAVGWNKLDEELKNIIKTSDGQGHGLTTEWGYNDDLGMTQRALTEFKERTEELLGPVIADSEMDVVLQ